MTHPSDTRPLDNYANKCTPGASPLVLAEQLRRAERRAERFGGRAVLWLCSSLPGVRKCGRASREKGGRVGVRSTGGMAGFAGLCTCGSVWACPVCNSKVMARRSLEIGTAVASATAQGLPVAFMTFTMRHHKGQSLVELWRALTTGWRSITQGKAWQLNRATFDIAGYVRVVEVTYGRNGWHVHVHVLVFGHGLDDWASVDRLGRSMWERWNRGLVRAGMEAPKAHASDWQQVSGDIDGTKLGNYLSKLGAELTQTQSKVARSVHSTRSTWALLDEGPKLGDRQALELWWEWEKASKGKRQIAWSRGLRALLGVGLEQTDDDIAAEDLGNVDDTLVWITRHGWSALIAKPWLIPQVLDQAEAGGQDGLAAWLQQHDIEHERA